MPKQVVKNKHDKVGSKRRSKSQIPAKRSKKEVFLLVLVCLIGVVIGLYYIFEQKVYIYQKNATCDENKYCVEIGSGNPITGVIKSYNRQDGRTLTNYTSYKNGIITGKKEYYENGQLEGKVFYKNGKVDGVLYKYYENGQLELEASYSDGKLNGFLKKYYENGQLQMEAYFLNDKADGVYKEYYEDGQLKVKGGYKNGLIEGPGESYYQNGQIKIRDHYKNNVKDGYDEKYYENGLLKQKTTYKNGAVNGIITHYDMEGNIHQISHIGEIRGGPELFIEFYKTGQIHIKANFMNGDDYYEFYTEDGQLSKKCSRYDVLWYKCL